MHDRLAYARYADSFVNTSWRAKTFSARLALLCALVAAWAFSIGPAQAQSSDTLRIQLLSGKTGRPVTNAHLLLWRTSLAHATLDGAASNAGEMTDGEGYATIPATDAATLFVHVDLHMPCSKDVPAFSLLDIRARGVVSQNICSRRIKLFPQQGMLVLFVRDETFFEKLRH